MASTFAHFVQQHLMIPMTNPTFIAPAVVISCIVVLAAMFFSNNKSKKPLPPLVKDGMFKVIENVQTAYAPQHINRWSRELNASVFRLPLPDLNPFIIVASPTLARTILEGDKSKGIVECEKSHHYAAFQKLFDMAPSFLFSKTDTERWRQGRKSIAPAFSTTNIYRQFPSIIKGVNQFHDILSKHATEGKPVEDLAAWFNKLIFDILGSGMFQVEFNLLTGGKIYVSPFQFIHLFIRLLITQLLPSIFGIHCVIGGEDEEVKAFSGELHHSTEEIFKMQVWDPLRKFQWWNAGGKTYPITPSDTFTH